MKRILKKIAKEVRCENEDNWVAEASDFWCEDEGCCAILNTADKQLEIYEDEGCRIIKLECSLPIYVEKIDEFFVVLDIEEQILLVCDFYGTACKHIKLYAGKNDKYVFMSRVNGNDVYIETVDGYVEKIVVRDHEIFLERWDELSDYNNILLNDEKENEIVADLLCELENEKIYLCLDSSNDNVFVRLSEGNSKKRDVILDSGKSFLSNRLIRIDKDKKMHCVILEDNHIVWESMRLEEVKSTLIRSEKSEAPKRNETLHMTAVNTRTNAVNIVYQYANFSWSIHKENQKTLSNTRLADYIAKLNLNSGPVQLTAMPYCWGAWDTFAQFQAGIAADGQASNVTSINEEYRAGTYGIDCSGLISRAYGLTSKQGTSMLKDNFSKVDYESVCSGDFLLKKGHVVMFHRKMNSTNYLVVDSTTDGIDKVTSRVLTKSSLDKDGYSPYTGWTTGHQQSSSWSYNPNYHFRVCANGCGKVYASYAHNWVQYSGYKRCSVCGYQI